MKKRILIIIGTRPEAIKMAPVIHSLCSETTIETLLCSTGQHKQMLQSVLDVFSLTVDVDLDLMIENQGLVPLASKMFDALQMVFTSYSPDLILVHGDTLTTLAGALVAYYNKTPVMHVEAGLRTNDLYSPWPEEGNRRLVGSIASFHFAPTEAAAQNLVNEGVDSSKMMVTGNTVIDALLMARDFLSREIHDLDSLSEARHIILVTSHRRENLGEGFINVCKSINKIARRDDVHIVFPLHLNPNIRQAADKYIDKRENISLIEPMDYKEFVKTMMKAKLILTDSGGIQEEAPSLNKPVLILRDTSERPEIIASGAGRLVGTDTGKIVSAVTELLDDTKAYESMINKENPYGDGHASVRIKKHILKYLETK